MESKIVTKNIVRKHVEIPVTMCLNVPKPIGKKNKPKSATKGNGTAR